MNLIQEWSMELRKPTPFVAAPKYTRTEDAPRPIRVKAEPKPKPTPNTKAEPKPKPVKAIVHGSADWRTQAVREKLWQAVRIADSPVWLSDHTDGGRAMRKLRLWAVTVPEWTVEQRKRDPHSTGVKSWCVMKEPVTEVPHD